MVTLLRQVMTRDPIILRSTDTVRVAAQCMRDNDIGAVLVQEDGRVGIVTDRDIVMRAVADDRDAATTHLGDICTHELCMMDADTLIDDAVQVMRERSVRRIVIVQGTQPVGVVTLGDLAMERDPSSALADISSAPPQH